MLDKLIGLTHSSIGVAVVAVLLVLGYLVVGETIEAVADRLKRK